jgi:hypothetical protein
MPSVHDRNRAFFSQDLVDAWLADGRIAIDGEIMRLTTDDSAFRLESAVLFQVEVSGAEDTLALCGKVKTLEAVAELPGEHATGSVVVGDNAYEVMDGFVGHLMPGSDGQRALAALIATKNMEPA